MLRKIKTFSRDFLSAALKLANKIPISGRIQPMLSAIIPQTHMDKLPSSPVSESPRIGVDARWLFFGQQTGVSRYLRNLLNSLLQEEAEMEFLLYVHGEGPQVSLPTAWRNARLRIIHDLSSRQKRLWENLALPRALRRDGVSLYFSPGYVFPWWLPCPGVVTVHDISFEVHPEWFPPVRSRYVRILARRSAQRARMVLTVSEFSKAEICQYYQVKPDRVRVTHEAAEPRFFEPVPEDAVSRLRKDYALPKKFLLYVGSLHQRRQIPELVNAVAQLHREGGFEHHLVLAGHNNFHPRTDISALIRKAGAEGLVHYCEFVPDEDLPILYAAADLVAYISRYEGFGLPVLEAMAAGKPVITASTTSLSEVAGDAACLVDPTSPEAIAQSIRRLAGDTDLQAVLAEKGRERARQFTWERAAKDTLAAFRDSMTS